MRKVITRVRNYPEVMRKLRTGPDFGIHGIKRENLQKILQGREFISEEPGEIVLGHYFAVGEKEKELPEQEFYRRLWSSIYNSLGHSTSFEIKDGRAVFRDDLCLLLGVSEKTGRLHADTNGFSAVLYGPSFPIGHDFVCVSVYPIQITMGEIEELTARVIRKYNEKFIHDNTRAIHITREIISRLVLEISKKLKQYQFRKSGKREPSQ